MRAGILVNSLPAALTIYDELKRVPHCAVLVLLSPAPNGSSGLARHLARLFLRRGGLRSLWLVLGRKVIRFRKPLTHPKTLTRLKGLELDVGLHKTGEIYRQSTIDAFRLGILNPHIGMLPRFRGRNVMEWSVLKGEPVGITVFFIDSNIDTGERIVLSEEIDISDCRSLSEARQRLFNLDAVFFRRAIELLGSEGFEYKLNDGSGHRYYVMSRLFRRAAEKTIMNF